MKATQTKREVVYLTLGSLAITAGSVRKCDVIEALGGNVVLDSAERARKWGIVDKVVLALVQAGHLETSGRPLPSGASRSDIVYKLTASGAEAVEAVQAGRPAPTVISNPPTWNRQLWSSARIMKRFTLDDIVRTLDDVPRDRAYRYLRKLVANGAVVQEKRVPLPETGGIQIVYRLVRDNGPEPPVLLSPSGRKPAAKSPAGEADRG